MSHQSKIERINNLANKKIKDLEKNKNKKQILSFFKEVVASNDESLEL